MGRQQIRDREPGVTAQRLERLVPEHFLDVVEAGAAADMSRRSSAEADHRGGKDLRSVWAVMWTSIRRASVFPKGSS
jgi:hypothetical protein